MNKEYTKSDSRFKYTSQELIKQVQEKEKELGKVPTGSHFKNRTAMLNRFGGTWASVLEACSITPEKTYTREELLEQIREKAKELGIIPYSNDFKHKHAFTLQFGSYNNAIIEAGFKPRNLRRTDEELLERIRELSKKICDVPTVKNYYDEYGSETVITNRFGSWNKAVTLAGLSARTTTGKRKGFDRYRVVSNEELISIVQQRAKKLGDTPRAKDMNDYISIIIKRFGKWNEFIALAGLECKHGRGVKLGGISDGK